MLALGIFLQAAQALDSIDSLVHDNTNKNIQNSSSKASLTINTANIDVYCDHNENCDHKDHHGSHKSCTNHCITIHIFTKSDQLIKIKAPFTERLISFKFLNLNYPPQKFQPALRPPIYS